MSIFDKLVAVANELDAKGFFEEADQIDVLITEAKYKTWKGKGDKPPHKDRPRPPKSWFNKMKEDVKKKNPDYSMKRVEEIVSDIWHNTLSDAKVKSILNK